MGLHLLVLQDYSKETTTKSQFSTGKGSVQKVKMVMPINLAFLERNLYISKLMLGGLVSTETASWG